MMIRELLTSSSDSFTKGERKVARELLTDYPTAGLGTAASLAARAHVSSPTVIRFVSKLGFTGFTDFQEKLRIELSDTMKSPLSMIENRKSLLESDDVYATYVDSIVALMREKLSPSLSMDLERAAKLLADPGKRITCIGGRFSNFLAAILRSHLQQLRSNVLLVDDHRAGLFDYLIDISHRDVLVVYDYRRYQTDIVEFCRQAKEQKATIVLFTDPYKSPIAAFAEVVVTTPVEVVSPYDTMTPALGVTEALIAGLTGQLSDSSLERLAKLETYRDRNRVTLVDDD